MYSQKVVNNVLVITSSSSTPGRLRTLLAKACQIRISAAGPWPRKPLGDALAP